MANVVRLNLCYGVPVKLYSGHLLLMALWLIWPDLPRIFSALVLNRATVSVEEIRPWSGNPRTRLLAVALKTVLVGRALYQSVGAQIENQSTNIERFGLTPAELRGIWAAESFELNGRPVSRWPRKNPAGTHSFLATIGSCSCVALTASAVDSGSSDGREHRARLYLSDPKKMRRPLPSPSICRTEA